LSPASEDPFYGSFLRSISFYISFISQLTSQGLENGAMLHKRTTAHKSFDGICCAIFKNDLLKTPIDVFKSVNFFFYNFNIMLFNLCGFFCGKVDGPSVNTIRSFVQFEISLANSNPMFHFQNTCSLIS